MGVGSALDEKYLILFEGPTASNDDDMVVEAKQIRDLAGNPCLRTDVGASRVLDGARLIAYEPFAYAAVVPHGNKYFWMHDWTDDYQEASIATMLRTPKDLRADRLRRGGADGPRPPQAAGRQRRQGPRQGGAALVRAIEPRMRIAMREMAGRTDAAWRAFTRRAGPIGPGGGDWRQWRARAPDR